MLQQTTRGRPMASPTISRTSAKPQSRPTIAMTVMSVKSIVACASVCAGVFVRSDSLRGLVSGSEVTRYTPSLAHAHMRLRTFVSLLTVVLRGVLLISLCHRRHAHIKAPNGTTSTVTTSNVRAFVRTCTAWCLHFAMQRMHAWWWVGRNEVMVVVVGTTHIVGRFRAFVSFFGSDPHSHQPPTRATQPHPPHCV